MKSVLIFPYNSYHKIYLKPVRCICQKYSKTFKQNKFFSKVKTNSKNTIYSLIYHWQFNVLHGHDLYIDFTLIIYYKSLIIKII